MGKLGAVLLLLAGLQIHIGVAYVPRTVVARKIISSCPVKFFGGQYTYLEVYLKNGAPEICFRGISGSIGNNCLTINDYRASKWGITRQNIPSPACAYELMGFSKIFSAEQVQKMNLVFQKSIPLSPISETELQSGYRISASTVAQTLRLYPTPQYYFQIKFEQQSVNASSYLTINTLPSYSGSGVSMTGRAGGSYLGSWSLEKNHTIILSACTVPNSGGLVGSEASKLDPQTCVRAACNSSLALSTSSDCGEDTCCDRRGRCVNFPVCTVTGFTVIDFHERKHNVSNRCMYTLINSTFSLLAGFRERRRQDVSLLDHLELSISGDTFVLGQGGRVLVNGQKVTLNATATNHGVVELSSDKTGVTVKLPNRVTIFFDGNTASVAGAFTGNEEGLCGRPFHSSDQRPLSAWKSESSDSRCEDRHNDNSGAVNCTLTAARCDLLDQEPFTACHDLVYQGPFIDACKQTLCKYPAVDGLKCQFLEAYVKACSLRNATINLEDWRSKANCAAGSRAWCQDQYCTANEFCGEHIGGTTCLCRALFAAKYKPSKTLGEAAVCTDNSATVTLAGCLLNEQGIDHSLLHLKDQTCKGEMDSETHMVTFSFNTSSSCGADVMMNNSQVIYKNTIMMGNTSKDGIITRHDQVAIDFSCTYKPTMPDSVSLKIKDSSVVRKIESGNWSYTLTMNAYTDAGLQDVILETTELKLDQKIWVELSTEGLDKTRVVMVIDSCWATNVQAHDATLRYDLIKNKCPDDKTVILKGNGEGTSNRFSFNVFEFAGKNSDVYLHCKLELCLKNGKSCVPTCNGQNRGKRSSFRSEFADKNPALITMAWTN